MPEVVAVIKKGGGGAAIGQGLAQLLKQEDDAGYVYSFPLFTNAFCDLLVSEASSFREFTSALAEVGAPGGGGSPVLAQMGLGWLDQALLRLVVGPITALLYPQMLAEHTLDWCTHPPPLHRTTTVHTDGPNHVIASWCARRPRIRRVIYAEAGWRPTLLCAVEAAPELGYVRASPAAAAAAPLQLLLLCRQRRKIVHALHCSPCRHTDDSEVTLNVGLHDSFDVKKCAASISPHVVLPSLLLVPLGCSFGFLGLFQGGELHFHHVRGTTWEGKTEPFSFKPRERACLGPA